MHSDFFSDALGFLIDGLCAANTASTAIQKMNDRELCDDDNSVSEDRTADTSFRFDLLAQHHHMCERDNGSCSLRVSPRPSSPLLNPTKVHDGTQVTAALTWESSFDINDALSTDSNYESNSIFRPKQDYDFERREQHANLVRMKQANYQLEKPATRQSRRRRRVLTSTLNLRPAAPAQLKYPDKRMKRRRPNAVLEATTRTAVQYCVMGRAA